jgi:hypothetical protein
VVTECRDRRFGQRRASASASSRPLEQLRDGQADRAPSRPCVSAACARRTSPSPACPAFSTAAARWAAELALRRRDLLTAPSFSRNRTSNMSPVAPPTSAPSPRTPASPSSSASDRRFRATGLDRAGRTTKGEKRRRDQMANLRKLFREWRQLPSPRDR